MTNNKKIYLLLGILLIILVLFFVVYRREAPIENEELKLLKQIFPEKSIISQDDKNYYVVDEKDYYVKSIEDVNRDGFSEFVVMEPIKNQGKTYSIYTKEREDYILIGQETSLVWYLEEERNKEIEIILEDITGDNISEIIIPFEENAKGNRWYQILTFEKGKNTLVKIVKRTYLEKDLVEIIGFDDLYVENGFVITTWHGTYSRGKSYYSVDGNILDFEKSVGAYGQPNSTEYEYREIDKDGNVVYRETREGSIWEDELIR